MPEIGPSWFGPQRDKYGRPQMHLYAVVQRDDDSAPQWRAQVVVTTMPKAWVESHGDDRYMVTNWMLGYRPADERTRPVYFRSRKRALEHAEALVAAQLAKTAAVD